MRQRTIVASTSIVILAGTAAAQDMFVFELTETGNPNNMISVGDNSLPDLAEDFADVRGDFSSFSGTAFMANLNYAGVANAISFTYDPSGGANGGELLTITNIEGFNGTIPAFDEANGDLGNQLQDFFLMDNPDALSDFMQEMARRSFAAVTDGNPLAATARMARYKYDRFGLNADFTATEMELFRDFSRRDGRNADAVAVEGEDGQPVAVDPDFPPHEARSGWRNRFNVTGGSVEAGDFSGSSVDGYFSSEIVFNEHLSLGLGGNLGYHELEGADVVNGAFHVDLPIRIINPGPHDRWGWTWCVSPGAAAGWSASYDYAAGGAMYCVGAVNRVTLDMPRGWAVTLAQSFTWHRGQKLEIGDYEFDPGVDQKILKVGGKVSKRLGDKAFVFGGATWTDFIEDAAVDNYTTPTAGFGFRFRNGGVLAFAYEGDFADDFNRQQIRFDMAFSF
jgi:hypothetical protein